MYWHSVCHQWINRPSHRSEYLQYYGTIISVFFFVFVFGFTKAVIVTFTVSSAMSFVPFQYSVIVTFTLFIGDVISTISVFCHCYIYYIHRRCCFHRFSIMLLSVKTGIVQSACMCVCARLSGWVLIYSPYEWFAIVSDVVQCRDRYWHVTNARLFFLYTGNIYLLVTMPSIFHVHFSSWQTGIQRWIDA